MKSIYKNIVICTVAIAGTGMLAGCEDFLTITPTDAIVEEEFWQDKNDLTNAVYGCYKRLASDDITTKMVQWGEMRSDNFERSTETSATGQVANILNANLLPTYNIFSWTALYSAINYSNKVLAHGPDVVANDESFSESAWIPIKAEMVALRALCHFYLIRTFGEIPYVTQDYNNDSQELRQTQEPQLTVLNKIIDDLEAVKDDAMTDYGSTMLNKGRITRKAIYTLLADVYLWRASYKEGNCHPFLNRTLPTTQNYYEGEVPYVDIPYGSTAQEDYQKCLDCCNKVIQMTKDEMLKKLSKIYVGASSLEFTIEDLLEPNYISSTNSWRQLGSTSEERGAYSVLFSTKNSNESIFELQFDGDTYSNNTVANLYTNLRGENGTFVGSTALFEAIESTPNTVNPTTVFTKTDYRRWETALFESQGQTSFQLNKYVYSEIKQTTNRASTMVTDNTNLLTYRTTTRSKLDANWIIYRMSEVLLMKAEAISRLTSDKVQLKEGFDCVRAVFKRSNPYPYEVTSSATDTLKFENNFDTQAGLESLVMQERQREFMCEGKRWFDLVRYAQRRGNTEDMLKLLTRKYATNRKAIEAKLADMQSLFSPVYDGELKSNTWLYQNGVWKQTESSSRTDNM
ncbi:MAG: RagB/SusD family nutrient uptake outer membrane protein [Bacteroidaceae bacterium]|nr:RagB/SusD family nutrient uptake outer membrane protein [Bacteroidaceae bacterium]